MTRQNFFLVLVVMILSAHNADLILQLEDKVLAVLKNFTSEKKQPEESDEPLAESGSQVFGIDVSHWQPDLKTYFDSNAQNWSFVICKATEGENLMDPSFNTNWEILTEKKIIKGAYHFYHPEDGAYTQAAYFLSVVPVFNATDLAPVVDVEMKPANSSFSNERFADSLLVFLNEIETKTKRTPIIYTNYTFGTRYLTDERLAKYPLWIADVQKDTPRLPGAWETWYIWQKGHDVIGKDTIDSDIFNGSMNDLREFIKHY